ncbi:MAG: TPM domain-containing protein, partial [Prolixibacteraceae bacterium]|nr:TPM domain-containing protein [Prolixibacteraceae bacterium]
MRKILLLFIAVPAFYFSVAQIPGRPVPPRLVNDFAGLLSENERTALEDKLVTFDRETSTQIVVVTIEDLQGYDPGDFAFRLGESWGVGQKDKDNGIVILVKPKRDNGRGQVFIATGYGLEGVLPDAVVNGDIINTEMIPLFKQNDYYGGLQGGINVIMDITKGEYTADYYRENMAGQGEESLSGIIVIIMIIIIFQVLRGRKRRFYSPGKNIPLWIALGMLSGNQSHRGSFGNFSSGSGSFGGFGGGSFGGGGAGGSW